MRNVSNGLGRNGVVAALIAALAVAGLSAVGPARAQSTAERDRIDGRIESVQSQVKDASAEEARLLSEIEASSARKRELDARIAQIDGEIRGVQRDLAEAERRLTAVETEQRMTEARLAVAATELARAKERLVSYAIAAYMGQSDATRYVGSLLSASTIGELAARRSYVRVVGGTQAEVISAGERLRNEVGDLTEQLAATQKEAEGRRDEVDAERARVQASRDAQASARAGVAAELATTGSLRGEVLARKAEFEAEIAELQRQSAEITELLRRRAAAQPSVGTTGLPSRGPGAGGMLEPIPGARVSSPFGYRIHPIYGDARLHTGVDLTAGSGTPIRATAAGVVVSAGWLGGYGNATIIEHGGGIATLYAHQSSMGVSDGQRVAAGEVIGRVGCTGTCTGPHLHFEVRADGTPVDPLPYIS